MVAAPDAHASPPKVHAKTPMTSAARAERRGVVVTSFPPAGGDGVAAVVECGNARLQGEYLQNRSENRRISWIHVDSGWEA
jgi:hypothetical protein